MSRRKGRDSAAAVQRAVLAPYMIWAVVFIVVPLFFIAYYAFTDDSFSFTTANITRFSPRQAKSSPIPARRARCTPICSSSCAR